MKSGEDGDIARSHGEAARLLGVTTQTIRNWLMVPGFPGRSGRPGTSGEGYFPIEEIKEWRENSLGDARMPTVGTRAAKAEEPQVDWNEVKRRAQAELAHTEAQVAKIKLAEKLGAIVDADDVRRLISRFVAGAKTILAEMPDRILSRLPSETTDSTRKIIREEINNCVRLTAESLAEMQAGDLDETQ